MTKVVLPSISSGYVSADLVNNAFQLIEEAFDNTVSRDGTSPNQMESSLDMNSNRILNLPVPSSDSEPMTYGQAKELANGFIIQRIESQIATAGQTDFTLNFSYEVGVNNLAVYVDGVRKFVPDYSETSTNTIKFASGLTLGAKVVFVTNDYVATLDTTAPAYVAWATLTGIPDFASRWPTWSEVTGKPTSFAPSAHTHAASDIVSGTLADARRGVYVQATAPTGLGAGDAGALWFW